MLPLRDGDPEHVRLGGGLPADVPPSGGSPEALRDSPLGDCPEWVLWCLGRRRPRQPYGQHFMARTHRYRTRPSHQRVSGTTGHDERSVSHFPLQELDLRLSLVPVCSKISSGGPLEKVARPMLCLCVQAFFASGARTADPIGTGKAPFDGPERLTDDGASFRVIMISATCLVPLRKPSQKSIGNGCRPNQCGLFATTEKCFSVSLCEVLLRIIIGA